MATWGRGSRGRIGRLAALLGAVTIGGCECQAVVPKTPAGQVYIPGGTFQMGHAPFSGSQACDNQPGLNVACSDFAPVHQVTLSPYFIDTYEVTFGDYKKCMDAGFCPTPWSSGSPVQELDGELSDPNHAKFPIWSVTPKAAERYCEWKGLRLPTAAEWERAARGPHDDDYPWGNDPPTCARDHDWAQACDPPVPGIGKGIDAYMQPVGSNPHDISAEGVRDLYGNAFEIVADLYLGNYYSWSPKADPTGPQPSDIPQNVANPGAHVVRGTCGADYSPNFDYATRGCPVWLRRYDPLVAGFRCAKDAS